MLDAKFSPDDKQLATASWDGTARIWNITPVKEVLYIPFMSSGVNNWTWWLTYSPDGTRLASASVDGQLIIWDLTSLAYSPDGRRVALSSLTGIVSTWDGFIPKQLQTMRGHTTWGYAVPFSRDGKFLATASAGGIACLWDTTTGANVLTLQVDSQGTGSVEFSPDGKQLAVGSKSGIHIFLLPIPDVIALAKSRLTRSLSTEECQQYLHVAACPAEP